MKHASVDRAKRVDNGCRNHGSCPYCTRSRTIDRLRIQQDIEQMMAEAGINPYTKSDFPAAHEWDRHFYSDDATIPNLALRPGGWDVREWLKDEGLLG